MDLLLAHEKISTYIEELNWPADQLIIYILYMLTTNFLNNTTTMFSRTQTGWLYGFTVFVAAIVQRLWSVIAVATRVPRGC